MRKKDLINYYPSWQVGNWEGIHEDLCGSRNDLDLGNGHLGSFYYILDLYFSGCVPVSH